MATFGTTSEAGTTTGGAANYIAGTKYTLTEDGIVSKISVYSPANVNHKGGIYSDNAGAPGTLIVGNNTSVGGSGWKDITLTPTLLTAGVYWLVFNEEGDSGQAYKAGDSNQRAYRSFSYSSDLPASFGTPDGYQNNDYVSYGTYSVVGTNMQVRVGDNLKNVASAQVRVGGNWKNVSGAQVKIGSNWKDIF